MAVRILHCGKSIENYNLCAEHKVAGFPKRVADKGDIVYLAVKYGNSTVCGARGVLSETTIDKPWRDFDRYIQAYKMTDMAYCEPFDLSVLSEAGGPYWVLKYAQGAKEIKDSKAIEILESNFSQNKIKDFHKLKVAESELPQDENQTESVEEEEYIDGQDETQDPINILGTFETVRFKSEQNPYMGLERSVNDNFYKLFPDFPEENTVFIKENKMFKTSGIDSSDSKNIKGIQGIPDALLIKYSKDEKVPLKMIIIEYECYGETKIKSIDKFNYLNGHIIPQLMRFASTFSIATDRQIREMTIKQWIEKIINYIWQNPELTEKVKTWIKELDPNIQQEQIALKLSNLLEESFKSNLGIMLVIDEMSYEQRDTIKNIIGSFKLENGCSINFYGFVVRLEQKICIINDNLEYALAIQQY